MSVATDTPRRPEPYFYSSRGAVYYTPRTSADRRARRSAASANPSLPTPHIGPRQRRPHSIHIVSYPSGFIPQELRQKSTPRENERQKRKEEEKRKKEEEDRKKQEEKRKKQREQEDKKRRLRNQEKRTSLSGEKRASGLFSKLKSAFQPPESQKYSAGGLDGATTPIPQPRPQARTRVRPVSWLSVASRLSRVEDASPADDYSSPTIELPSQAIAAFQTPGRRSTTVPPSQLPIPEHEHEQEAAASNDPAVPESTGTRNPTTTPLHPATSAPAVTNPSPSAMVDVPLRAPRLSAATGIGAGHSRRNSFMSVRSAKSAMSSSVQEIQQPKPIASGSGLSCTIILAEPNVFLTGFDHDGHTRHESHNSTALLRGKLQLNVSKNTKVKSVTLKLLGKARTEWPEGIPPLKVDMYEEESLRTQALTFFHAMHDGWETEYGNQCTYRLKGTPMNLNLNRSSLSPGDSASVLSTGGRQRSNMSAKELKRLSLRSVESRSFGKGESPVAHQVQAKGFKVFFPGTYEYSFELPIDHHQLETIKLQYGAVKWELEAAVERAGAFKTNLHGTKEVSIVRVPDQMSLETSEPISISRQWEDQLHYDIMISGKSFPIGAKIPIAFKLTPLAKVQVHKLKVFVTEAIEYWTNDRKVTRKDPGRKILLLEKTAGKPLDKQYESSQLRILSGGELSPDEREVARQAAQRRRTLEAQRTHSSAAPLPEPTENLLGDLDLGLETYWGSTEMEMNVQMPTCEMMAKDKSLRLHPDCSWKNVNVYHWMKIVMRISRIDPDDPAGKRRRHFEISIDSPFTVLNCRATQANTALPEYNCPETSGARHQASCGCPDAQVFNSGATPDNSSGSLLDAAPPVVNTALPMPPQAAHLHTSSQGINGNSSAASPTASSPTAATAGIAAANSNPVSPNPLQRVRDQENPRPIHLLRYPSFDPPPFDYDQAPPPLPTPPPNYDIVVGTPSVDGLADYFQRLSHYEDPALNEAVDDYLAAGASGSGGDGTEDITPPAHPAADEGEDTEVESDSDSADEQRPARTVSRVGTVNVANPRTPGGRLVPSRSFEIERPAADLALSMAGVVRRNGTDTAS
jgi:arrestin-related trafficking adapter 3/6